MPILKSVSAYCEFYKSIIKNQKNEINPINGSRCFTINYR